MAIDISMREFYILRQDGDVLYKGRNLGKVLEILNNDRFQHEYDLHRYDIKGDDIRLRNERLRGKFVLYQSVSSVPTEDLDILPEAVAALSA